MQLVPPTREVSREEAMAALREHGFDGLLFVERVESGSTSRLTNLLTGETQPQEFVAFDARLTTSPPV
jgi:hypothetical protein